jgi:hypothetical protein
MGTVMFIWLLCGILAAIIGARKGRGALGFILGCVFGPFGVLAAFVIKGDSKECPSCKELMRSGARVCPHCQRDAGMDFSDKFTQQGVPWWNRKV